MGLFGDKQEDIQREKDRQRDWERSDKDYPDYPSDRKSSGIFGNFFNSILKAAFLIFIIYLIAQMSK